MGKSKNVRKDAFSGYALASEAMLLVDNEKLANDIEFFFTGIANLFSEAKKSNTDPTKKSEQELEGAYLALTDESRRLIKELRKSLHGKA